MNLFTEEEIIKMFEKRMKDTSHGPHLDVEGLKKDIKSKKQVEKFKKQIEWIKLNYVLTATIISTGILFVMFLQLLAYVVYYSFH